MKKELLLSALKSLEDSLEKDWEYGDIDDWSAWAVRMQTAIKSLSPIIKIVADDLNELETTPTDNKI